MKREWAFRFLCLGIGLLGLVGRAGPVAAQTVADSSIERFKVPLGNAPQSGVPTAKVTIIEFTDYQCPFCSRVQATLGRLHADYGSIVRFVLKHNPLPFHQQAKPAAYAALAAGEQGDKAYWAYHGKLFANQAALDDQHFEDFARELGLDVALWKKHYFGNRPQYDARIAADQAEASRFDARGTPTFFLNGRRLAGAQPYEEFQKIIDAEIVLADKLLAMGVTTPANVYLALTANAKEKAEPQVRPPLALPDPKLVFKIPLGAAPQRGPATAKVTIVEWGDFQCPFCARAAPTMRKLLEEYPDDLRLIFKHNPLPFHVQASLAARAAVAAEEQGKFWEYHDKLLGNQNALLRADLESYAVELGLDLVQFNKTLDSSRVQQRVASEQAEAERFDARGTPSFFINGKPVHGAQPYEHFKRVVDSELRLASERLKDGVAPSQLYAELTRAGRDRAETPPPAAAKPEDSAVYRALVGQAPVRGARSAKVTIVMWSDFQCPFCARVEPTLTQLLEAYPKDLRIVFKQKPLPFHDRAHLAAEAALAAHAQGKFWAYHDLLFENQQNLDADALKRYARELGLDLPKFSKALDSGAYKSRVDAESAEGEQLGANGTPTFFINGHRLSGAQPLESFKIQVDAALKQAEDLMRRRKIPAESVYAEILKGGPAGAPPPSEGAKEKRKAPAKK